MDGKDGFCPLVEPERRIAAVKKAVGEKLFPWFQAHRRAFPWRTRRTPYRVWVSELMLQQTRTDQAIPYYEKFLRRFPTVESLARAPLRDVLKAWEGLGYYSRARNAHRAARTIVEKYGGRFPRTFQELLELPGIGAYTAAAVGSLAMGLDLAVVDGNVMRVLSRLMAYGEEIVSGVARKQLDRWARDLLVPGKAGLGNEALMELGAVCCTPRNPHCGVCPLEKVCVARKEGAPEKYPVKKAKKRVPHKIVGAAVIVRRDGRILIAQRKETSMLGGLWEFPGGTREAGETMPECIARELKEEMDVGIEVGPLLTVVHHAYSHFTIDLHAHWARVVRGRPRTIHCADFAWVSVKEMKKYPFSRADLHIIDALKSSNHWKKGR